MPNAIGARKNSGFKAISSAPSFNKTPVGSATPPLPYPTFQDLGNSVGVVPSVKFNGNPVYVISRSSQPSGKGDSPGVAKGIKSNKVTGQIKPTKASRTVNAGGKGTVRQGDPCTMNGGNNPGMYCTTQMPSMNAPASAAASSSPPVEAQTEPEKSLLDQAMEGARSLGQKYQGNVSESLHGFAAQAMEKGGTIAAVGGGTAAVGGAVALTGVGAAPGAAIAAGGGAVAAVGGGVSGVGAVVETVATGLDAAAAFATSGKLPNLAATATAYAERMVMNKVEKLTRFVPGMRARGSRPAPPANARAPSSGQPAGGGGSPRAAGDGTTVVGRGRRRGRCELRPYREGCDSGTPHHVVPDHCFKQPGANGAYYPGAIRHADGLCICVEGSTKSTGTDGRNVRKNGRRLKDYYPSLADHGKIHSRFDILEAGLGRRGTPRGTASLGELERLGSSVAGKVTGCDAEDLRRQLRSFHSANGLDEAVRLRADPFGSVKNLDPAIMGKAPSGPTGRR